MNNKKLQEKGIIYCATGKELFLNEAYISINSIKKYHPNLKISLFIDEKNLKKVKKDYFDSIFLIKSPEYGFGDKIYAMKNTPYEKTIYLDCDTVITDDISEIFEMLKNYDIAASNPPFKNKNYKQTSYQAGIIFYRMTEITRKFLNLWDQSYDRINHGNDQPSFRRSLSKLPISLFVFPPNYNFRLPFASYIHGKIKIIHDHDLSRVKDKIRQTFIYYLNESHEERYWFPKKGILRFPKYEKIWAKLLTHFEEKFLKRIGRFWNKFPRKKLINYFIIKAFPWFINWVVPKKYRERMINLNKKIKVFESNRN